MKIRTGIFIKLPPPEWRVTGAVDVHLNLTPALVHHLNWLAQRWQVALRSVVSDILMLETFGRHRLDQLIEHGLGPRQEEVPANPEAAGNPQVAVRVLPACCEKLETAAQLESISPESLGARMVRHHLLGNVNPLQVQAGVADPEGLDWHKDDEFVSLWMPQSLTDKVQDLSQLHSLTRSDVLRNTLLLKVYGRIRYEQWTSEGHWRPKRKSSQQEAQGFISGTTKFSPQRAVILADPPTDASPSRPEFIKLHGKSIEATKVFLPACLKHRLVQLAQAKQQPVSEYCRHLLVAAI